MGVLEGGSDSDRGGRIVPLRFLGRRRRGRDCRRGHLHRQVLRIARPHRVESLANRPPQHRRSKARRQSIYGNDSSGMQQRRTVVDLEFRVVEGGREAAAPDLAADYDPCALSEPAGDEPASKPGCLHFACFVAEIRRCLLDPPPEGLFDAYAADLEAGARGLAVGQPGKVAGRAQFAQVVVPPGQVEQQVADRANTEPWSHSSQDGCAGHATRSDRRVGTHGTHRPSGGRARRGAAPDPAGRCGRTPPPRRVGLPPRGHFPTPPRSGTGSAAGRRQ